MPPASMRRTCPTRAKGRRWRTSLPARSSSWSRTSPPPSPHVNNGTIRALAVTSLTRSPLLPDVPTVAESGVAGFENSGWFGLLVPAGTPQAIVNKIHADTVKVLERREMKERLSVQGMAPVGNTPAAFASAIAGGVEALGAGGERAAG